MLFSFLCIHCVFVSRKWMQGDKCASVVFGHLWCRVCVMFWKWNYGCCCYALHGVWQLWRIYFWVRYLLHFSIKVQALCEDLLGWFKAKECCWWTTTTKSQVSTLMKIMWFFLGRFFFNSLPVRRIFIMIVSDVWFLNFQELSLCWKLGLKI